MIGNFYFNWSLNEIFTPPIYFRMTLELIDLGHVTFTWLLIRVLSELGTRFCKVELSHQYNKSLRLYDLHSYIFRLLIHNVQAIKIKYIIIWNLVVPTCSTVTALYLNKQLFWWWMIAWYIGKKNNWIFQIKNLEINLLHNTFVLQSSLYNISLKLISKISVWLNLQTCMLLSFYMREFKKIQ